MTEQPVGGAQIMCVCLENDSEETAQIPYKVGFSCIGDMPPTSTAATTQVPYQTRPLPPLGNNNSTTNCTLIPNFEYNSTLCPFVCQNLTFNASCTSCCDFNGTAPVCDFGCYNTGDAPQCLHDCFNDGASPKCSYYCSNHPPTTSIPSPSPSPTSVARRMARPMFWPS